MCEQNFILVIENIRELHIRCRDILSSVRLLKKTIRTKQYMGVGILSVVRVILEKTVRSAKNIFEGLAL